jgi:Spy/CpxP family protein refolding chaperone
MKSLKTILASTAITAVAAGALLAQSATTFHPHRHAFGQKMATALGLTDQQKSQAKTIFQDARTQSQPVREALKQERQQIQAAIKSGKSPSEVQQMAQSEGPQMAQLAGIRAAAFAKLYAILTPDQQQKLATMHQNARQQWMQRRQNTQNGQ